MTDRSDPEDVLLSIRRLVGGEGADRGETGPEPLPILLLGSAVRVRQGGSGGEAMRRHSLSPSDGAGSSGPTAPAPAASRLADAMRVGGSDAALRALVADVVREELAGELGQRMTRNLRQLVLRELRAANASGAPTRPLTPGDG